MLRNSLSFLRRDLLIATSYKSSFAGQGLSVLWKTVTFFYIGQVFGGYVGPSLQEFNNNYFAYLLLGIGLMEFMHTSLESFDTNIRDSQMMGTLEIVLLSPIPVAAFILYSSLWAYIDTCFRFSMYLILGYFIFDLNIGDGNPLTAICILLLAILCFAPLGIVSATVVMVFKRGTWFRTAISGLSFLVGGIAYPAEVLPAWLQQISFYIPITHAASAMRQALIKGSSLAEVMPDIWFLVIFAAIAFPISLILFSLGLAYTKRAGTLTHY